MKNKNYDYRIRLWKPTILILLLLGFSCKDKTTGPKKSDIEESALLEDGFISLFNGKTLEGWEGDDQLWRVENGVLTGELTPDKPLENNTFLIWQGGKPADFELKLEFRITESGNSGINYRSEQLDSLPFALKGYQADIDGKNNYTGQNYEERKRTTLAYRGEKAAIASQPNPDEPGSLGANIKNNAWQNREVLESLGNSDSLRAQIKSEDWNECHLIIKGNRLQHYINGILMSEVIDNDTLNRELSGYLGLQLHVGPPMKVEYRNIRLR